jgi:NDP-sugar pyrophosphorylase family protein
MIQKHFGTGRKWDVNIKYIFEKKPLGTAGCLRLLSQEDLNSMPLVVTNSDLVTDIDFKSILSFHSESKTKATICVSEYDMMIPFGVIRLKGNIVEEFLEKPVEKFFINAGIYVLDHRVLNDLDSFENKFDMNNLIDHLTKKGEKVGAFPIYEYWMDVGQLRDFKKVKKDFKNKN